MKPAPKKVVSAEECPFRKNICRGKAAKGKSVKERHLVWMERRETGEKHKNKAETCTNRDAMSCRERGKE